MPDYVELFKRKCKYRNSHQMNNENLCQIAIIWNITSNLYFALPELNDLIFSFLLRCFDVSFWDLFSSSNTICTCSFTQSPWMFVLVSIELDFVSWLCFLLSLRIMSSNWSLFRWRNLCKKYIMYYKICAFRLMKLFFFKNLQYRWAKLFIKITWKIP